MYSVCYEFFDVTHRINELLDFSGLFLAISCLFAVRSCKIYFVPSQISDGSIEIQSFCLSEVRICDLGTKQNCFVLFEILPTILVIKEKKMS